MSREDIDAAIIGAGHNGLVCAYYLARAGLKVVVFERADCVGGAAVTEEFHPGFRNSVASYTVSLLAPTVIADMALARHGLRIVPRPMANFVPQHAGAGLELHADGAKTREAIARHSSRDAQRYSAYAAELASIAGFVRACWLEAPVDPLAGWREWPRALRFLPRLRELAGTASHAAALWSVLTGSAGDWLDRWFEAEVLKGALGFDAVVGHYASPYAPGSAYLLLHHALGEIDGVRGAWGHAIGGMGAVTAAMAAAGREAGVEIRLGDSVDRIARDGAYLVVRTAGGVERRARIVAGAIHPQTLYMRLVDASALPEAFRARIAAWRSESASFRINVALAELPSFSCRPGTRLEPHHGAGILLSMSLDYLDAAYLDARRFGHSRAPIVELLIPSTQDDSLAPAGAHVASLFCQHFPRERPDGRSWSEAKSEAVDAIFDAVTAYAPNFRRAIVGVQALSPEDLETRFGLVGGDIFHGQMTLDQLYWARPAVGYASYRSPVPGLYLCGAGSHPGGGVSGAPGHNAAQTILRDLRRVRSPIPRR
ncbi:MAG TPA: NAD(P)/FAD-dependent oxidoreductase [Gammaproteobacteria bacterium]|nr:NAD(P)/FAD-dependent oxidoreductase [Gammaproteobacteria bacterium]